MDRPKVIYQDSTKQAVADDWKAFVREQLAPLPVICPKCNGVVQVETERHLFGMPRTEKLETDTLDAGAVQRVVEATVGELLDVSTWQEAIKEISQQANRWSEYRSDGTRIYNANRGYIEKTPVEHVTEAVMRRFRLNGEGGDLYTYCVNCEQYVAVELPGFMRSDVQAEFVRRVVKGHTLEYTWQKPESVLPALVKAEPKPLPSPEPSYERNPPMVQINPLVIVGLLMLAIVFIPLILRMMRF